MDTTVSVERIGCKARNAIASEVSHVLHGNQNAKLKGVTIYGLLKKSAKVNYTWVPTETG